MISPTAVTGSFKLLGTQPQTFVDTNRVFEGRTNAKSQGYGENVMLLSDLNS